jgi:hypothetical protein
MKVPLTVLAGLLFYICTAIPVYGQAVGFGCLGFVGGFGGYSFQRYNPTGLNNYISTYNSLRNDSLSSPMGKFGSATGYRVGLNFFRANIEGFILTTKGYYQFLSEKREATLETSTGSSSADFEVEMKNWGVGVDLGTSITKALSWKVIDAALLYSSAVFSDTRNYANAVTEVNKYSSEASTFGYSIGTGFILELIDEYVSLEGLAGYTVFNIDKVQSNGNYLSVDERSSAPMNNFIESGGFNAVLQLNIGFPL